MILVTGATGTIGSEVVRRLAARGEAVRALTRDPSRAPAGVEAVAGDLDRPESLAPAVAGAETIFLLTRGGPSAARHDLAMVEAARSAGVRKIVKLSSIGLDVLDESEVDWHREGERAVRDSGLVWTMLRPSAFASNTLRWAAPIRDGKPIPNLTADAAQGVVDPRDVAEVAADALVSPRHEGKVYSLTGPELLTTADQAAQLGAAIGTALTTIDVPIGSVRAQLLASGMDTAFADATITGLEIIRSGRNAVLADGVERALGRPPGSFKTWAIDHATAFSAPAE
ncbi:NAD(P)H-binding protein [Amycolatopsis sp. NPDC059657]|uniref:NAD(P)H-binding protein n=1 Tax=Amycolatopsis sp. NPDC059657 TaxID=3346899 RepID=UPI00366AD338